MQEIGTWTTEEGTVSAVLVLESEIPAEVSEQELPGWVSGALSGALGGAATGSVAGPWGLVAGAATGAILGGATAATKPQASPPSGKPPSSPPPAGPGAQSSAIQALQQFAAAVPALIQLVAASGAAPKAGKTSELGDADGFAEFVSAENLAVDEWTLPAEDEGAWTTP